ncbi:uncharacterized protein DC041_0008785 [Schistosoma bovis]|uniref:Uncharacterized protein n=1 Tax=Schistosoma bovis TaxID=6184 RepID=A0A430Q7H7_SCHBO|nr:uncharacterized protein DC041_0008785 [Schistosoma bovis]
MIIFHSLHSLLLAFMILTSPTVSEIHNHNIPSLTNQTIITSNEILSNELNTFEPSIIVATNSNSVSLSNDCKTSLTH